MKKLIFTVTVAFLATLAASAQVRFKNIYQNHMVLQADEPNVIAGRAEPGQPVEVSVTAENGGAAMEKKFSAKAGKDGRWSVSIPAYPKRTKLEITASSGGASAKISDVLTGQLWLASGQSNMEWNFSAPTVSREFLEFAKKEADSTNGDVRIFTTRHVILPEAIDEVTGDWKVINGNELRHGISQICFFFASKISKALDTPVGVINSSWGGSRIEPWISKEAFLGSKECKFLWNRFQADCDNFDSMRSNYIKNFPKWLEDNPNWNLQNKNSSSRPRQPQDVLSDNRSPSCMYNAMISGIAPLSPRGVLWYQGESNAGQPHEYGDLIKLMVTSWRKHFKRDFPFYYVELAAFTQTQTQPVENRDRWGSIREAQAEVLTLPKTGVATSADSGGSPGNQGDIHPPRKDMISTRLANLALAEVYGKGSAKAAKSPSYKGYKKDGSKIVIEIDNPEGLRPMAGSEKKLTGFAIRGDGSKQWKWADAEIKGDKIIVSNPEISKPEAVRYGWASWPLLSVESRHGLPLRPFSTDKGSLSDFGK